MAVVDGFRARARLRRTDGCPLCSQPWQPCTQAAGRSSSSTPTICPQSHRGSRPQDCQTDRRLPTWPANAQSTLKSPRTTERQPSSPSPPEPRAEFVCTRANINFHSNINKLWRRGRRSTCSRKLLIRHYLLSSIFDITRNFTRCSGDIAAVSRAKRHHSPCGFRRKLCQNLYAPPGSSRVGRSPGRHYQRTPAFTLH